MAKRLAGVIAATAVLAAVSGAHMTSRAAPALDYDFFKTRVQMVFLEKRATHTRCYICHAESNNGFRLERLASGETFWTEEQSRKNFEMTAKLVNAGDPDTSRLLMQPLAPEGGGNVFHVLAVGEEERLRQPDYCIDHQIYHYHGFKIATTVICFFSVATSSSDANSARSPLPIAIHVLVSRMPPRRPT